MVNSSLKLAENSVVL